MKTGFEKKNCLESSLTGVIIGDILSASITFSQRVAETCDRTVEVNTETAEKLFSRVNKFHESSLMASYVIRLETAKAEKSFADGVFGKQCAVHMGKTFNEENVVK